MYGEQLRAALEAITAQARSILPESAMRALEDALGRLAASGVAENALRAGDTMPDFTLPDAFGKELRSADARAQGALVLCFYRGGWCPYCSLELRALQAHLPAIRNLGAALVAISPQMPDGSLSTQEKLGLGFPVLSDIGNAVARRFGIVFKLEEALRPFYRAMGADLPEANGDDSFELPMPATYVVSKDGTIVEAFVQVDYRSRPVPEAIIDSLKRIAG